MLTLSQAASCTLDASVKIYSYRVDSVHHETYRVLGGLNRTDMKGGADYYLFSREVLMLWSCGRRGGGD
jgi:hypothetical protein